MSVDIYAHGFNYVFYNVFYYLFYNVSV